MTNHNTKNNSRKMHRLCLSLLVGMSLSACNTIDRLSNVGNPPPMSKIENPQLEADYRPVSMPMPAPRVQIKQANSLWASDRKNFFQDQRASDVGDILTVMIDIQDEAALENETTKSRTNGEEAGVDAMLGIESSLDRVLPEAIVPGSLADFDSSSNHTGTGEIEREEEITVQLAALITQILPNGNFVIHGKQEVMVNFEKRILQIDGVIRPEDISTDNTISHQQIAEARIVYGGEGALSDMQQPRYGTQIYDILFPF
ncbi:MAG: flagellar basal body L-ring protein FlgH [Alphaproteobacteria bacterium]|jgi:flagellar L-ring protein precursor FlgH|nr:flagellar basal body L-ring protein FlgH [Alphaproteobacteria bacterium]MDP7223044.1 flagellar basal body L-ring protein FlgH [Alphaproteobacteria bacterium]